MTVERSLLMTQPSAANYIEDVFSAYLYTGNGTTQTITNNINISGKGGLVWIKDRTNSYNHNLFNTVNGATNFMHSNTTDAMSIDSNSLTAFGTTGFTLGSGNTSGSQVNTNTDNFVSWTFRKQNKFFDVQTKSHTNGSASTVDLSGLGTVGMVIVKRTDSTSDWYVWHRSLTASNNIKLNSTAAETTTNAYLSVSSTTLTLSSSTPTGTYVIYAYAHDAGGFGAAGTDSVVACGSFTTDGSGGVPAVTLGWEPQFLIFKSTDYPDYWRTVDIMRGFSRTNYTVLYPDVNASEASNNSGGIFPTATGFASSTPAFVPNTTYIYLAIRRGPMKTPTSGTSVFSPNAYTWGANSVLTTNFPVDTTITNLRNYPTTHRTVVDRLRGSSTASGVVLFTDATNAESSVTNCIGFDSNTTEINNYWGTSPSTAIDWNFGRAPGFFDVVCYTGTGSATTQTHNLGVAPEMIIVKGRSISSTWQVYTAATTASNRLILNLFNPSASTDVWNYTAPTSSVFSVSDSNDINGSGYPYVAYLFATCPGVSKVGSYTGTAAALNINCGFAAGARFVLIKRTDNNGDWYVYDSARGISSSDDPYLLINSDAVEVTNTNYVDAYASGFSLTATAPADLNANGGTYIYLAIA